MIIKSLVATGDGTKIFGGCLYSPFPLQEGTLKLTAKKINLQSFSSEDWIRFWSFVDTNGPIPELNHSLGKCWIWKPTHCRYGRFWRRVNGKMRGTNAHRLSYTLLRGKIPANLFTDHLCRNTGCVNPFHLELVTLRENSHRGIGPTAINYAKTHCINGHPLSGDNLFIRSNGIYRRCKKCQQRANLSYYHRTGKFMRAALAKEAEEPKP